eukprot:TRINITY_DN13893_c0_g1_i1.p1 TRINITY_DN13893_c0_g1~~TRINITY_DN13893_c0_g1_i1.p1  ORF type:complete len:109 (+),score=47.61 TRINITY_DN13893_c0_g1_i1:62-388(+)
MCIRDSLKDHIRKHTNDRPYACKVCKACFMRSSTLKVHFRTHSGEKPYKCDFPGCGKTFSESGNMNTHKKIHGKIEHKKGRKANLKSCLLYTSPSPRDQRGSRMPSSA